MKISLNIDINDKQLAQLKDEAQKSFNNWSDTFVDSRHEDNGYWPTPLELFAIRLLLFELTKE